MGSPSTLPGAARNAIAPPRSEVEDVDAGWDEDHEVPPPPSEARAAAAFASLGQPGGSTPPPSMRPDEGFTPMAPPAHPDSPAISVRAPAEPATMRPSVAPGYGYRASQRPDLAGEMKSRFAEGDFSGALVFAESLLESDPDHAEASLYLKSCRDGLAEAYLGTLGTRQTVPHIRVSVAALPGLGIDTFEAYVLSCVDGNSCVEDIVDVVGKPDHETLRALAELLRRQAIRV